MRRVVLRAACAAVLLALVPQTAAAAGARSSPPVYHGTLSGVTVAASGESYDGCTLTAWQFGAVRANRGAVDDGSRRGHTAFYWIGRYDACTGDEDPLSFFTGTTRPEVLRVAGDLSSAYLKASIPLSDAETGAYGGRVEIDQTWTATAPATRSSWHHRNHDERTVTHLNGMLRDAVAHGSLPATHAYLGRFTSVHVQVLAPPDRP